MTSQHPPMPPLCDWIRSDKGEPVFLMGMPLRTAALHAVDWIYWSQMPSDMQPYALARVKAAWYDGAQPELASQWDKWADNNS